MRRLNSVNDRNEKQQRRQRSQIGSQLPEEFYDYLDQRDLVRNDRFLKRFGKRLFGVFRRPLLRRNRSNITLFDSEIDSNFSLAAVTPKRAFSLLSQRTLLSRKNNRNGENFYMESLKLTNGMLSEKPDANGDSILLNGEETAMIKLEKENGEFGFNIVGGTDQEYIPGHSGIFISRIQNGGSAARDKRLKIGDRIISVNGILLADKTHNDAIQILQNTKSSAVLMIEQNAESRVLNKPTELSGMSSSDESTLSSKSEQGSLSSNQFPSMSSKSMNTYMSQIVPESAEIGEMKNSLSSYNEVIYPPSNSTDNDYPDGKDMMKNDAENQNEISVEHKQIPSIFNEVLAVSVGIAALGAGIYVVYKFITHRSTP
uniref:PDZ domain-containing protein n=1 Tax=Wuchereria bancrofti TaxID=6293 RepID=A0A1I8EXQ5_WUCBA